MNRRSWLWAIFDWLVAGVLGVVLRKPVEQQLKPLVGDHTDDPGTSHPAQRDPETSEDLVLIIHGGALCDQMASHLRPVHGSVYTEKPGAERTPQEVVIEHTNDASLARWTDDPEMYPRTQRMRVVVQANIGTVDELVEDYRKNLLAAKRAMAESFSPMGYTREQVNEHLAEMREKQALPAREGDESGFIPWSNKLLHDMEVVRRDRDGEAWPLQREVKRTLPLPKDAKP